MIELQVNTEFACGSFQHAHALGHDFFANAVSSDDGDTMFAHGGVFQKIKQRKSYGLGRIARPVFLRQCSGRWPRLGP